jgi:hypothetical protein
VTETHSSGDPEEGKRPPLETVTRGPVKTHLTENT